MKIEDIRDVLEDLDLRDRLRREIEDLRDERDSLRGQVEDGAAERGRMQAETMEARKALARLEGTLAKMTEAAAVLGPFARGEITHIGVCRTYRPWSLQTLEEATRDGMSVGQRRMISLVWARHDRRWEASWQINQYPDGSGVDTRVFLGTSEEDVLAKLRAEHVRRLKHVDGNPARARRLIEVAERFGWPIDDDLRALVLTAEIREAEANLPKLEAEVEKYTRQAEDARAALAESGCRRPGWGGGCR